MSTPDGRPQLRPARAMREARGLAQGRSRMVAPISGYQMVANTKKAVPVNDRKPRPSDEGAVTPAELTRRTPDDEEDGAGPGAPETVEPTQGREGGSGPGGPAMKGLGTEDEDEEPS